MTDETTTPAEEATGQPEPSTQPDSAEGQPATSMTFNDAMERLEALMMENKRLRSANTSLREALDEALGVHKPVPFPCTVYRAGELTTANGEEELKTLLGQGWSETK